MNKKGGIFLVVIIIAFVIVSLIFLPYWYKEEEFHKMCDEANGTITYSKTCSVGDDLNSAYKYSFICSDFKVFIYSNLDVMEIKLPVQLNCAYTKIKLK